MGPPMAILKPLNGTNEIAHCFLMYSRATEMYLGSHYSGAV